MTTYAEQTNRLATELAHLAVSRSSQTLNDRGLGLAVSARAATLELLRTVQHDVTGISRDQTPPSDRPGSALSPYRSVERVQAHPVAALSRVLEDHPTLASGRSTMIAIAAAAATAADSPADRTAAQAWAIDPRHRLVEPLTAAANSGLQVAAREAMHLARTGPLPAWGDPGPEKGPQGLMLVTNPAGLAAAHQRLPAQITAATELSPRTTAQLLQGQLRLLGAAAAAALRDVDPARAQRAYEIGGTLRSLPALDRGVVSLTVGDRRPLLQTAELVQHLARAERADPTLPAHGALAAVVDQTPRVLTATAEHVARSLRSGRWLVPDHDAAPGQPVWRRVPRGRDLPQISGRLQAIAARALTTAAFPSPAPVATAPSPHQVIDASADLIRATYNRPATPTQRPDAGLDRG